MKRILNVVLGTIGSLVVIPSTYADLGAFFGDDDSKESKEIVAKDYSDAFKLFSAFNVPDLKGATYISFRKFENDGPFEGKFDYEFQCSGNGWLLDDSDKKHPVVVLNDAFPVTANVFRNYSEYPTWTGTTQMKIAGISVEDIYSKENQELRRTFAAPTGMYDAVDLEKDVKSVIKTLKRKSRGRESYENVSSLNNLGEIFFFAYQLHSAGYTKDANVIAHLILENADKEEVVLRTLSYLADSHYNQAYSEYLISGNTTAFIKTLQEMIGVYQGGWLKRESALELIAKLKKQEQMEDNIPESIKSFPEEYRNLYQKLRRLPLRLTQHPVWLLSEKDGKADSADPIDTIMRSQRRYVPFLLALLDDTSLTRTSRRKLNGNMFTYDRRQKKNLNNSPASIGEIAWFLLVQNIPRDNNNYSSETKTMSQRSVIANNWYQDIEHLTDNELAAFYLSSSSWELKKIALRLLLAGDPDKYSSLIEDVLLRSAKNDTTIELVRSYVQKRRRTAQRFLEKMIVRFDETDIPDDVNPMYLEATRNEEYYGRQNDDRDFKKQLITLRTLVDGGIDTLIKKIVTSDYYSHYSSYEELRKLIQLEGHGDAMKSLLQGILKSSDTLVKSKLMNIVYSVKPILDRTDVNHPPGWPTNPANRQEQSMDIPNKELWRKVFEDFNKRTSYHIYEHPALAFNIAYNRRVEWNLIDDYLNNLGEAMGPFLVRWADMSLKGEKTPEVQPLNALSLGKDKRTALDKKMMKATEQTYEVLIASLSLPELAHVDDVFKDNATVAALWRKWGHDVSMVSLDGDMPDEFNKYKDALGSKFGLSEAEELIAFMGKQKEEGSHIDLTVYKRPMFGGCFLEFSQVDKQQANRKGAMYKVAATGRTASWEQSFESTKKMKTDTAETPVDRLFNELHVTLIEEQVEEGLQLKKQFYDTVKYLYSEEYPASAGGQVDVYSPGQKK